MAINLENLPICVPFFVKNSESKNSIISGYIFPSLLPSMTLFRSKKDTFHVQRAK